MPNDTYSLSQRDTIAKIYAADISDTSFLQTSVHVVSPALSSAAVSCSASQWPLYCTQNNTDSSQSPYHSRSYVPIHNQIVTGTHSDSRSSQSIQNTGSYQRYEKPNRGLRHFSMKVLQKVQQKVTTTYNEVADELVNEFGVRGSDMNDQNGYDQKNIRRRVYDALNVLMAMNIITKEKKEIKWVGLPTNSLQECQHLENEKNNMLSSVREKLRTMKELIIQLVCMKNLAAKNSLSGTKDSNQYHMELPFILLSTSADARVECSVSDTKDEYLFQFDSPFEVHDDFEILKRLGYSNNLDKGDCSQELIDISKTLVPRVLHPFIQIIGQFPNDGFEDYIISHRKNIEYDVSGSQAASNMRFINNLVEYLPRVIESTGHNVVHNDSGSHTNTKSSDCKPPFLVQSFES